jgi:hypothetical protein
LTRAPLGPAPRRPQLVARNWRALTVRVCTHASLMCAALHLAKRAAKRAARGHPRAEAAVAYVCDVLLPTGFYGPLMGVGLVAFQSIRELVEQLHEAT